jgi:hypothetical protein
VKRRLLNVLTALSLLLCMLAPPTIEPTRASGEVRMHRKGLHGTSIVTLGGARNAAHQQCPVRNWAEAHVSLATPRPGERPHPRLWRTRTLVCHYCPRRS